VTDEDNNPVWFHGFETTITGALWNFDLWFRGEDDISEAKRFIADVNAKTCAAPALKDAITSIKMALIEQGQYFFCPYSSMDVYTAVFEHNVRTINDFYAHCSK
jgi:hypothetical protein